MQQALGGVIAKLWRAEAHLESLNHEWTEYIRADPSPYSFIVHEDREAGEYLVYVEILKPPPDLLSVIVGDALHNLRSALDHLAWELVTLAGAKPGVWTHFPICDSEADWVHKVEHVRRSGDRKSPLHGIEPGSPIWKFIEAVQPYKGAMYAGAMRSLRTLSNADKHRALLVSGIYPDPDDFAAILDYNREAGLREQRIFLSAEKPIEDGDKVAALSFDPAKPYPELDVKGELGLDVAFSDGKWDSNRPALADLKTGLAQYVEYTTGLFLDPPQFDDPANLADLSAPIWR